MLTGVDSGLVNFATSPGMELSGEGEVPAGASSERFCIRADVAIGDTRQSSDDTEIWGNSIERQSVKKSNIFTLTRQFDATRCV